MRLLRWIVSFFRGLFRSDKIEEEVKEVVVDKVSEPIKVEYVTKVDEPVVSKPKKKYKPRKKSTKKSSEVKSVKVV